LILINEIITLVLQIPLGSDFNFMERSLSQPPEITRWLQEWSSGKENALEALMPVVYAELHRQAASYLRRERVGHTLHATALINEAYLKLIDQREVNWQNRAHFFGIAAQAMRRILVDHARTRHRDKRGGDAENLPLEAAQFATSDDGTVDLIALDEALTRLALLDERQSRIVELRFFSGLSVEETAEALGVSPATVKNEWRTAKAWLFQELNG
jgi:RNA polymerase sigma-70 factor, ECF subfamily